MNASINVTYNNDTNDLLSVMVAVEAAGCVCKYRKMINDDGNNNNNIKQVFSKDCHDMQQA
eukprot:6123437-Ditylum_brightwellii.AAC.1